MSILNNIRTLLILVIIIALFLCSCQSDRNDPISTLSEYKSKYNLYGLNFSPYINAQNPNLGTIISEEQLRERLQVIASYTMWVRTFGSTHGLEKAGRIGHEMDLLIAAGAWLDRDLTTNDIEITNLIEIALKGDVEIAIVGSEVLLRGDLTEEQLINYLNQVRQAIPNTIPVTTADNCSVLLNHPNVITAVDLVLVNHYPYWEGIAIDCAISALHNCHKKLTDSIQGKPIIVSETGWPSCGNTIGEAVPSLENASFYFLNFISWARENNVLYFYFSAFDESWKAQYEGPQGACWGIWDKEGSLKPGMRSVFDDNTISNNWSDDIVIDGPGIPSIMFTLVPEYGSFNDLKGNVKHINPFQFKVAVYIYVSGWWTKPYFSRPSTNINCSGSWICDITTGGIDERATRISAYLLPSGYDPPLMSGGSRLPADLDDHSVAKITIERSP